MARMLNMDDNRYAALEKNERYATLDEIKTWSEKLDVPIQDFLPDTISINNSPTDRGIGIVFGNYNNYFNNEDIIEILKQEIENIKNEINYLKKRNS